MPTQRSGEASTLIRFETQIRNGHWKKGDSGINLGSGFVAHRKRTNDQTGKLVYLAEREWSQHLIGSGFVGNVVVKNDSCLRRIRGRRRSVVGAQRFAIRTNRDRFTAGDLRWGLTHISLSSKPCSTRMCEPIVEMLRQMDLDRKAQRRQRFILWEPAFH